MYTRVIIDPHAEREVTILFDGKPVRASIHDTVASVLLVHGIGSFRRSPVTAEPRAPYCMMGACFECLMTIDGVPHRQACMVSVRDGMEVTRPARGAEIVHAADL